MAMNIPIPDPTKKPEENVTVEEDYTNLVDEEGVIGEFNELILKREKLKEQIKTAQGEDLKALRNNLKEIKGTLNDLKKSDDFKEQKKQYSENTLKAGALPADYYVKKEPIK